MSNEGPASCGVGSSCGPLVLLGLQRPCPLEELPLAFLVRERSREQEVEGDLRQLLVRRSSLRIDSSALMRVTGRRRSPRRALTMKNRSNSIASTTSFGGRSIAHASIHSPYMASPATDAERREAGSSLSAAGESAGDMFLLRGTRPRRLRDSASALSYHSRRSATTSRAEVASAFLVFEGLSRPRRTAGRSNRGTRVEAMARGRWCAYFQPSVAEGHRIGYDGSNKPDASPPCEQRANIARAPHVPASDRRLLCGQNQTTDLQAFLRSPLTGPTVDPLLTMEVSGRYAGYGRGFAGAFCPANQGPGTCRQCPRVAARARADVPVSYPRRCCPVLQRPLRIRLELKVAETKELELVTSGDFAKPALTAAAWES